MSAGYQVDDHGHVTPHVLKPREAAEILGLDESTVYRMIDRGECPDAFALTSTVRKGVPAWWVEERINAGRARCGCACHQSSPASVVVAGVAGPPPSLPAAVGGGGPHLRPVHGVGAPRTA